MKFSATAQGIVRCQFTEGIVERPWDVLQSLDFSADPQVELCEDGSWLWQDLRGLPHELAEVTVDQCPGLIVRPHDELPAGAARQRVRLRFQRPPTSACFGLGQRMSRLRRDSGSYANWTNDPPLGHGRGLRSLDQSHPFMLWVDDSAPEGGRCRGLYLHSSWYSHFDLGESMFVVDTLGGQAEVFLFPGPTVADVLEQLTALTGRPLLPPLWALGHHQSRWGYRSAAEILEIIQEYRRRALPLDVVHMDIDYMDAYRCFTFHPERFPDPKGLAREAREQGVRLVTIIDPGIRFDLESPYGVARDGCRHGHFLKHPDGSPRVGFCWPDAALFTDYCSHDARHWWGEQQRVLVDAGISGIWIDMNEPAVFDRPFSLGPAKQLPFPLASLHCEGATHAETHNLYGHLMSRATFEGLQRLRPQERPWVLTRSACVGTQAYAASWMGDNHSWWEHLHGTLPQLLGMGLSGSPWVGADVGGFAEHCTGELLVRWYEQGIFYPFLRNHSAHDTLRQEPWRFDPVHEAAIGQCLHLRYRLLPYLYSLAHETHRSGAPLLRPLFWEFPADATALHIEDQALLGPFLLIAPIVSEGLEDRSVYLPAGRWINFWDHRIITGPSWIIDRAPWGQPILWLREGTCLPLGNLRQHTGEPLLELTWVVFADGRSQSHFTWVSDDDSCTIELRSVDGRIEWHGDTGSLLKHDLDRLDGGALQPLGLGQRPPP